VSRVTRQLESTNIAQNKLYWNLNKCFYNASCDEKKQATYKDETAMAVWGHARCHKDLILGGRGVKISGPSSKKWHTVSDLAEIPSFCVLFCI